MHCCLNVCFPFLHWVKFSSGCFRQAFFLSCEREDSLLRRPPDLVLGAVWLKIISYLRKTIYKKITTLASKNNEYNKNNDIMMVIIIMIIKLLYIYKTHLKGKFLNRPSYKLSKK